MTDSQRKEWLDSLRPGDVVAYNSGNRSECGKLHRAEVTRRTKARIFVGIGKGAIEEWLHADDGTGPAADIWDGQRKIEPMTPERAEAIDRRVLARRMREVVWADLDLDTLCAVWALVTAAQTAKKAA